uniref:Uncharacterized protein n=1 Tax=Arundo donax TaxID=35708 RepID=A0A0A8ZFQ8_ARUDO
MNFFRGIGEQTATSSLRWSSTKDMLPVTAYHKGSPLFRPTTNVSTASSY